LAADWAAFVAAREQVALEPLAPPVPSGTVLLDADAPPRLEASGPLYFGAHGPEDDRGIRLLAEGPASLEIPAEADWSTVRAVAFRVMPVPRPGPLPLRLRVAEPGGRSLGHELEVSPDATWQTLTVPLDAFGRTGGR